MQSISPLRLRWPSPFSALQRGLSEETHACSSTTNFEALPLYGWKDLTGDDIRVFRLHPGNETEDLYAEIAHMSLNFSKEESEIRSLSTIVIEETLPDNWRCFKTPEGRLFYNGEGSGGRCQYNHPFPDTVPDELSSILKHGAESWIEGFNFEIDEKFRFEALSYVWGDPTPRDNLYIRDAHDAVARSKIPIASNLSSALRHLRSRTSPRLLWVDAVCINQISETEKGEQVPRIPNIYESAWRVIAWLGEASFDSALAIDTMQYLGEQIEISQCYTVHSTPDAEEKDWYCKDFRLPYSTVQWEALTSLMERPWFSRLWVLQEITLANANAIVQCGHTTLAYLFFRRAMAGLNGQRDAPMSLHNRITDKFWLSCGLQTTGMWSLITMAREHVCLLSHDKIYGLLGFMGPVIREHFQPSYKTSFPQTCKDLFVACSRSTGRLELLAHCLPPKDADVPVDLPTWTPDWRYHTYGPVAPSVSTLAAGMSLASFREATPGQLIVTGIVHGAVDFASHMSHREGPNCQGCLLQELIRGQASLSNGPTGYSAGEDMSEVFAKILCRNELRERFPQVRSYPKIERWIARLNELDDRGCPAVSDDSSLGSDIRAHLEQFNSSKLFRTEHGYFGSGPSNMSEGDKVCIVLGLQCPLAIRHVGDDRFKVIGGCYLHGFMDGEALLGPLPANYSVTMHQRIHGGGRFRPLYKDANTGQESYDDPRLGAVDQQYMRVMTQITADDPQLVDFFRNTQTGEIISWDPRMTKEALEQRGVQFQDIRLV